MRRLGVVPIVTGLLSIYNDGSGNASTGLLGIVGIGALIAVLRSGRDSQDSQVKAAI